MKDERLLKKVDKLLKLYGVNDEEREKFIIDLKDKKYDDQEEVEEVVEDEEKVEEPETPEIEEKEEIEEGKEEEIEAEPTEDEPVEEIKEEEGEETEEVEGEPETPELPEEQPVEEPVIPSEEQPKEPIEESPAEVEPMQGDSELSARLDELSKANQELAAKVDHALDIIAKLGIEEKEEEPIGVTPTGTPETVGGNDAFDYYMRKRQGNNL